MPSSLTRVFPRTLDSLPAYLCRFTVRADLVSLEVFLGSVGFMSSSKFPLTPLHVSAFSCRGFPLQQHTHLDALFQPRDHVPSCVAPSLDRLDPVQEFQPVVHRLRFSPRLRSRLTLSRRSLLRNPRAFGGKDSHLSFRYSYRHSHFLFVHMSFRSCFFLIRTLPYP